MKSNALRCALYMMGHLEQVIKKQGRRKWGIGDGRLELAAELEPRL